MKNDLYKRIYYICVGLYLVVLLFAFYDNYINEYSHSLIMTFVSAGLLVLLPLFFALMKWRPVYEIYIVWIVFVAMASLLGSSLRFYNDVLFWDKYTHCFSGVLGTLAGYILFCTLKKCKRIKKEDLSVILIFIIAINISIATLWELYEYAGLVLADYDGIRHYSTGVHDSMQDIFVCILGSVPVVWCVYHYYKSGKANLITNVYERFYTLNVKK